MQDEHVKLNLRLPRQKEQ